MTICQHINELTAWPCSTVKGTHGESVTMLAPPVSFWDGSVVPVYIFDRGEQIEITDDGGVLQHLDISGFDLSSDKRRRKGLQNAVSGWNATFDSELQVWCKPDALGFGLQRYLAALFAIARWESDNSGRPIDNGLLITEAEAYLRALNPRAEVHHDIGLLGISGKTQSFPLQIGAICYDAAGSHPASSSALVKKLFDVRSVPENKDRKLSVVVNDRTGTDKQTRADIQIFSQLAFVDRLTDLESRAKEVLASQPN